MKKYFIGMLALVLAVGFSAFTKPSTALQFTFTGTGSDFQDPNIVSDVSMWIQSSSCASNVEQEACTIEVTDAKYYHTDVSGVILNDASFAQQNPGEEEAVLSVSG